MISGTGDKSRDVCLLPLLQKFKNFAMFSSFFSYPNYFVIARNLNWIHLNCVIWQLRIRDNNRFSELCLACWSFVSERVLYLVSEWVNSRIFGAFQNSRKTSCLWFLPRFEAAWSSRDQEQKSMSFSPRKISELRFAHFCCSDWFKILHTWCTAFKRGVSISMFVFLHAFLNI